jgi:hypothetical protein
VDCTQEEFLEWWNGRITQEFIRQLEKDKREIVDHVGLGGTIDDVQPDNTGQMTARAVGKVEGLSYVIERKFVDYD